MAAQSESTAAFYKQLGRMYAMYTGSFIVFVLFVGLLEWFGVPNRVLGYLFVGFTLLVYAIIGVATRTAQVSEYYVAGRRVPAFYNGMATGADWMSAASFVGMAGTLFLLGYDGIAWVLGWTGGYVLVSILVGPYLRKFGAYTVPDFLAFRFGGPAIAARVRRTYWLVLEPDRAELCIEDPGFEVDLYVEAELDAMVKVWLGDSTFDRVLRSGELRLFGPRDLARAFPSWWLLSPYAAVPRPPAALPA